MFSVWNALGSVPSAGAFMVSVNYLNLLTISQVSLQKGDCIASDSIFSNARKNIMI